MKNILICLVSLIIIVLTFAIPNLLFRIEDLQNDRKEYSISKAESKIDVKAQKVYLVKVINEIQNGRLNLAVNDLLYSISLNEKSNNESDTILQKLKRERKSIIDNMIIKEEFSNNNEELLQYEVQERNYSNKTTKYVINQIVLSLGDGKRILVEMEEKTGKILLYSSSIAEIEGLEEEEILKNFVKYLDLYIIDDWKYGNNMLISEKAKLFVTLSYTKSYYQEIFYLSIQSLDKI